MTAFGLDWLQKQFAYASSIAAAGPVIKASGERYGNASCHLSMALHNVLETTDAGRVAMESLRALVEAVGSAVPLTVASGMRTLVAEMPVLLDVELVRGPNGVYDLPQIIATAYYARVATASFGTVEVSIYKRFLVHMQWLLLNLSSAWLKKSEPLTALAANAVIDAGAVAVDSTGVPKPFALPPRLQSRMAAMGRDLMPTPISLIAAVGVAVRTPVGRAPLGHFVRGIHAALVAEPGRSELTSAARMQLQYLVHMRHFLSDASDRLVTAVMPCDRVPIVAPWYASVVLSARTYAHVLAIELGTQEKPSQNLESAVDFTLFSLLTMADATTAQTLRVPAPTELLFRARSKSMYLCGPEQDGAWWVLLRATLSAISVDDAGVVADKLVLCAPQLPDETRTVAMFCVLMHTQAGMAIVGRRTSADRSLDSFPVAALISRSKDPAYGQTPLDMLMTTFSGTCDLHSLASDDLAFAGVERQEHAWVNELSLRREVDDGYQGPSTNGSVAALRPDVVSAFCGAMHAIGLDWISALRAGTTTDDFTAAEMTASLMRTSAAHAAVHCGEWLTMAFEFACELERWIRSSREEPPLIASPISPDRDIAAHTNDVLKDEAFLRLHFCMLGERALHSARDGGMWAAGNHLVMVAWMACRTMGSSISGSEPYEVRVFARAITPHTIAEGPSNEGAKLLTHDWRRSVEARGDDSVVECARQFERALHSSNVQRIYERSQRMQESQNALNVLDAEEGKETSVALEPEPWPAMPSIPRHSNYRHRMAEMASGPSCLDASTVPALDDMTDVALERLRAATQDEAMHSSLLMCVPPFAHGCAVGVVGMACTADDIRRVGDRFKTGTLRSQRVPGKLDFLERLIKLHENIEVQA